MTESVEKRNDSGGLGLSALVVGSGTLLSRVFGLIRDMAIATVFGASRVTDVFFIAYQIPSLFRKLLAEGALSSAVVPVYVDVRNEQSPQDAHHLASATFTATVLGVGGFVALCILGAPLLVGAIAPGFLGTPSFDQAVYLTRVMFPFLLMMSGAAVAMGVLHARKHYATSAYAPVLLNVSLISSVLFLAPYLGGEPEQQVPALAVGVLVGGFLQFYVQWQGLSLMGGRLKWNPDWELDGLKRIVTMMGPMVLGLAVVQMIAFVDKIIASFLDPGNISHLYYSNRLFQFPFGLVGIALGTVVLPESSEHVSKEDLKKVARTTRESLGMMTFLLVPASVGLALIGRPLIGVLFERESFTTTDQSVTAAVLLFALFGLVAYGIIRIFVSLCYSFEDTKGPVLAASVALVLNVVLDVLLVWGWPGDPLYRVCGLTLAGSLAVWVQARVLRVRLRKHVPDFTLIPWSNMIRHLALSAFMAVVLIPLVVREQSELVEVISVTLVGAAVYVGGAYWVGDPHPLRLKEILAEKLIGDSSDPDEGTD